MKKRFWLLTVVLASALALGACSDDEDPIGGTQDTANGGDDTETADVIEDASDTDEGDDTNVPPEDTEVADTGGDEDTGPTDTGEQDTGGEDTGVPEDTAPPIDTAPPVDTNGGNDTSPPDYEVVDCSQVTADVTVDVVNNSFQPATANVNVGDVVQWDWQEGNHSVTSGSGCTPDGNFDSGVQSSNNFNYCVRFNTSGSVPYYCTPHCSLGMTGTVNVNP